LARHHAWLAAASVLLVLVVRALFAGGPAEEVHRLSLATAYVGMVLLVVGLVIGPINVVRGRPSPLSDDLRRDVGIWAALLIAIHTFFGLQVHFGGTVLPYFLKVAGTYDPASFPRLAQPIAAALPFRIDPFGIGNETGLLGTLIALGLLVLSNDLSMRALGNRRWKRLQQLNYVLFALTVVHGLLYQDVIELGRPRTWIAIFWLLWGLALSLQLLGVWWRVVRLPRITAAEPRNG
jgi:sulfoxide reductase heme-binding subunit YedZ